MKNLHYKKYLFLLLGGLLFTQSLYSQNDFTLYNMAAVPQVTLTNPATLPKSRFNLGLPGISGIYLSAGNSGFTLGEALEVNNQGQTVIDVDNLKNVLADRNFLTNRTTVDLFMLGFRVANNYFHLHARNITEFTFTYPRDAFVFLVEGNGESFLGQRASFDGFGVDLINYNEYSLGYTRRVNQRLTVGARFKYLYGFGSVYTRRSQFGITTAEDYSLTIDGAFEINTGGFGFETLNNDPLDFFLNSDNTGYGFDFGARFKVNEQIAVSASVVDLGQINWRDNVSSFVQEEETFTFSGIDIGSLVEPDTSNLNTGTFTDLTDSLTTQLDVDETPDEYSTPLNTKFYAGVTYNLTGRMQVSLLTFNQIVKGNLRTSASVGLNTSVANFLSMSVNYSAYGRSLGNVGAGLSVNLGPVQIYTMTDNILAPLNYDQRKNFHFRFGINITTGRDYEAL